jgi:hypothetical protein
MHAAIVRFWADSGRFGLVEFRPVFRRNSVHDGITPFEMSPIMTDQEAHLRLLTGGKSGGKSGGSGVEQGIPARIRSASC